jgi:formate hydrogenlyase transcriptional activator
LADGSIGVYISGDARPRRLESKVDDATPEPGKESLLVAAKRTLELIASGASLTEILDHLCRAIDAQNPAMMSTVLLAEPSGTHLRPAAGPRVPSAWAGATAPVAIAPDVGSCGAAAYLKERVIVSDVATDPRWSGDPPRPSGQLAMAHGIRASWSQPLLSKEQEVLGTFCMYYSEPCSPCRSELQLIEDAARLAVIAVEGERAQTALRQAFEKLRQDEQELRQITDVIPQLIVVLSPDGTPIYANRMMLEYTGLTMDDVAAPGFHARISHAEDIARWADLRRDALARGVAFETEERALRHDGQYRWFLVRYNPLRDQEGRVLRWYATGTDIDDRKQAEDRTRNENLALREDIDRSSMFEEIVGSSLRPVLAQVAKVAGTDATVLILGETGTGKELVARAIHKRSPRANRAFIRVNCAAIPPSLVASELFGHEKGAFTGALQRRIGRFEAADGGTIFLDEIGDLPAETQVALLRVLQERELERVGSSHPITVDVRVLAATNRDLEAAVERGTFREDLFYRLNVFPIQIPPLRERADDIPVLVEYLVDRYATKAGKRIRSVKRSTLELFQAYDWPGNVRELQNVIERAVVLCEGDTFAVEPSWLKGRRTPPSTGAGRLTTALTDREKALIEAALAESHGRISGAAGAAAKLGIPRQTLESKIRALHIDKLAFRKR